MLLRDFRRPCPCCTDCYYPPLSALLGPTHGPWRSKKPLPYYFHDPPPGVRLVARAPSYDSNNATLHRGRWWVRRGAVAEPPGDQSRSLEGHQVVTRRTGLFLGEHGVRFDPYAGLGGHRRPRTNANTRLS
jgi:hypothetical protein